MSSATMALAIGAERAQKLNVPHVPTGPSDTGRIDDSAVGVLTTAGISLLIDQDACHKAQGSAFPKVIIPIVESRILDRTLIYTALTRAKRQVVFVGDTRAFAQAIQADPASSRRDTGLAHREQTQAVLP